MKRFYVETQLDKNHGDSNWDIEGQVNASSLHVAFNRVAKRIEARNRQRRSAGIPCACVVAIRLIPIAS
jgi:hypothetical protein